MTWIMINLTYGQVVIGTFWQLICDIANYSVWYDLNADYSYESFSRLFIAYVNKEKASFYLGDSPSREFFPFV